MPPRNTSFRRNWLTEDDGTGNKISTWCREGRKSTTAKCFLCDKEINVALRGIASLKSHAVSEAHVKNVTSFKKNSTVTNFVNIKKNCVPASQRSKKQEDVMEAELRWVAHQIQSDNSFLENTHISKLLGAMFKDSETAGQFSCGKTKTAYLAVDALAVEFEQILIQEMKTKFFSLLLDEKSVGDRSYVAFLVRFLNESDEARVLTACFSVDELHSQNADTFVELVTAKFRENQIPFQNLTSVMCDSCPTMRGKRGGFISKLRQVEGFEHVQDLGGCSLHHVHNAVKSAVAVFGEDVETFAKDVYNYFRFNKRHEYLSNLQQSLGVRESRFIRVVETRWLLVYDVVCRLTEQWSTLKAAFNKDCTDEDIDNRSRFCRIQQLLSEKLTLIRLHFLQGALRDIKEFELHFQSSDCKVHLLHEKMEDLITGVMVRFLSPECMMNKKIREVDFQNVENHLERNAVVIGTTCSNLLKDLSESEKNQFFHDVKRFQIQLCSSMLKYFPIGSKSEAVLIRGLSFLNPTNRRDTVFEQRVLNVAKRLSTVVNIEEHTCLTGEVRRFAIDEELKKVPSSESDQLISFWIQLKAGGRYPVLSKLACVCLCMPHGNADSERILKQLANNVTAERSSLKELTIHSISVTKSTMNAFKWRPDDMPVTPSLLERGFNARQSYEKRLKLEKEKQEIRERENSRVCSEMAVMEAAKKQLGQMKKSCEESMKSLEKKKEDARHTISVAQEMLKNATNDLAQVDKEEKRMKNRINEEKMISKAVKRVFKISGNDIPAKYSKK